MPVLAIPLDGFHLCARWGAARWSVRYPHPVTRRWSHTVVLLFAGAIAAAGALPAAADPSTITAAGDAYAPVSFRPADSTWRDLGASTALADGRRMWAFGDTFEPGAPRYSSVHSNTVALTEPGDPGTFVEPLDPNGHRGTTVPLTAPEAALSFGQRFFPVEPARVHDTRQAPGTRLGPGQYRDVTFAVPADISGPASVVFNLTAINTTASGTDLEVTEPTAPVQPTTSGLNLKGHETAANLQTAAMGPSVDDLFGQPSTIRIRNSASSVELIIDLVGFVAEPLAGQIPGARAVLGFSPTEPTRVYDSTVCGPGRNLGPGETVTAQVRDGVCLGAGSAAVPANAAAVLVNLTADGPGSTRPTHLTAYAEGAPKPSTSNLNLADHDVRANLAVVGLAPGGGISLYNSEGSFRAIVDVLGYFTPAAAPDTSSAFVPIAPSRACDTREAASLCAGPLGPQHSRSIQVEPAVVPRDATAVALTVTAVFPTAATHLTVWGGGVRPGASNLNAGPGSVRAAMVVAKVGASGEVEVFNNSGSVDVIVDVVGFFAPQATTSGSCSGVHGRIANWPASIVDLGGGAVPGTDRVAIYYTRWLVCSEYVYLSQGTGVAFVQIQAGRPAEVPLVAERHELESSPDGSYPTGAHVKGGILRDGFVYLYGCDHSSNGCFLRRAAVTSDLGDTASYTYFAASDGSPSFSLSVTAQTPIPFSPTGPIPDTQFPASDLSVDWFGELAGGTLVMMYEPRWDSGNRPVIVRTAPAPWGPWSEPVHKADGGQPHVAGCDVGSLDALCRAFHLNPGASDRTHLWFSFYAGGDHMLKHSVLPIG